MGSKEDAATPDRAFWLLSDETRVDILRALWAAEADAVPFTELRERVGKPDSGRFNYHLNELRGHFVARVDGGYELTQAGLAVVRAVLAGTLTERPRLAPAPIDGECADCGATLVASYDGRGHVECPDCRATAMWNEFPPAGLAGRTPEAFARAFDRWTQSRFRLAMEGVCPNCAAEMTTRVLPPGDDGGAALASRHRCRNCRYEARVPLFGHVLQHPAVVSFYHDAGVDVTGRSYWELRALADGYAETVLTEDPWTVRVAMRSEEERLDLVLDGDLAVTDVERSDR